MAGTFFLVALAVQSRGGAGSVREAPIVRTCAGRLGGVGLGRRSRSLAVFTLTFTTFLTHPSGIYGIWTGLDYWLGQHGVGRGGEPRVFYVVVLFGDEWPVLLLGAVGAVLAFRRPTPAARVPVWAFVLSLAVYSWAGEKFAWLVLHPLLPLILLAGVGAAGDLGRAPALLRQARPRRRRRSRSPTSSSPPSLVNARPPRRPARAARLHAVLEEVARRRATRSSR